MVSTTNKFAVTEMNRCVFKSQSAHGLRTQVLLQVSQKIHQKMAEISKNRSVFFGHEEKSQRFCIFKTKSQRFRDAKPAEPWILGSPCASFTWTWATCRLPYPLFPCFSVEDTIPVQIYTCIVPRNLGHATRKRKKAHKHKLFDLARVRLTPRQPAGQPDKKVYVFSLRIQQNKHFLLVNRLQAAVKMLKN